MEWIPEHKIDEIRDTANIVEVVSNYVNLQQAGNLFKGLCPFHAEKTPSFTVNPEKRIFHCFGCGVGGNVFRFLMLQKSISFPEAVRELADRYSIELPRENGARVKRNRGEKEAVYKVVSMAKAWFQNELHSPGGARAYDYLIARGIKPDTMDEYGLGWAPDGWDNLSRYLNSKGVPFELIEKAGLARPRKNGNGFYDAFRSRIITPIYDLEGKPVAFGGRILQEDKEQPKYINSPETPIYSKGRILYGLEKNRPVLKSKKRVLIVEGYFDLLSLAAHGVRNAVATLGTALTANHLRLLKGYVQEAILVFDADEAGRAAAARTLPLFLSADLEGSVLSLPDGHDPDTFVREFGPQAVEKALETSVSLVDFYLDMTLARHPATITGKSKVVQEVMGVINRVEGRTRVEILRKSLAERLGVSEKTLLLAEKRREQHGVAVEDEVVNGVSADFETEIIRLALLHPETASQLFTAGIENQFQDRQAGKVFNCMAMQFNQIGRVDADRLVEELDPEEAGLVTGLALSEDGLSGHDLGEVASQYINKFAFRNQRASLLDLSRRIKQAQDSGNMADAMNLLKEKAIIQKQIKN